jgi:PhnB protein
MGIFSLERGNPQGSRDFEIVISRLVSVLSSAFGGGLRMAKRIDPLNRKNYRAVNVALTVTDVKAAMTFYQRAFGFRKRGIMRGPDGKPIHAELTLRDTVLMLGPEVPGWNRSPKTLGGSPFALYLYVEDADKVFSKALKLGAVQEMPVADMFWGDRCGNLLDPQGYRWSVGSHVSEPSPREMAKKMKEQMAQMAPPPPQPSVQVPATPEQPAPRPANPDVS